MNKREGGFWNRNGRMSGGDRHAKIPLGTPAAVKTCPHHLSIQCFERRHHDCHGRDELFGGECECSCHARAKAA